MQKREKWVTGVLAILVVAGFAFAGKTVPTGTVVGKNGWTSTEVFRTTDLADALLDWSDIPDLRISVNAERLVENSAGELYVIPRGWREDPEEFCSGLVHYDPAADSFTGISQSTGWYVTSSETALKGVQGEQVFAVAAVPGDGGALAKDDILVLRQVHDEPTWNGTAWVGDTWVEVVRYPADASQDGGVDADSEEVLFTYTGGRNFGALAADGAGNVYVICVDLLKAGVSLDDTIRKLTYDSGADAWSDSELLSGAGDLWHNHLLYRAPYLYGIVAGDNNLIIEIDPANGAYATYSGFPSLLGSTSQSLSGSSFDADGKLRLALRAHYGYVAEAPKGGTASNSAPIAESYDGGALATRAAGGLWVSSGVYSVTSTKGGSYSFGLLHDAVFSLTPPAAGGGGGGGGGHGGGKNK